MCQARFSLWRVERQHETAGLIVADLLRNSETWLLDEGPTFSTNPGMTVASRLFWPAEFAMTCRVIVPVNVELIDDALYHSTAWLPHADPQRLADNPRFATAIYHTAIETGIMDNVVLLVPAMANCTTRIGQGRAKCYGTSSRPAAVSV